MVSANHTFIQIKQVGPLAMGNAYGFDQATMDYSTFGICGLSPATKGGRKTHFHLNQWVGPLAMANANGFDQAIMDGSFLASAGSNQRRRADEKRVFTKINGLGLWLWQMLTVLIKP